MFLEVRTRCVTLLGHGLWDHVLSAMALAAQFVRGECWNLSKVTATPPGP